MDQPALFPLTYPDPVGNDRGYAAFGGELSERSGFWRLLTVNTGSSSLKAAIYGVEGGSLRLETRAVVERIGSSGSLLEVSGREGERAWRVEGALTDHTAAVRALLEYLRGCGMDRNLGAIGHRIVHGGRFREPRVITEELVASLRKRALPLDPDHLPQALGAVEELGRVYPGVPQVACFDTAFHRTLPRVARLYALPRHLAGQGVLRYGFHGLSYEYVVERLRTLDPGAYEGRTIIAHLGSGASMTAVRGGRCLETTMGLTPTSGLVMATRSGDLDPGVLLYLLRRGMDVAGLDTLVNKESGLLGVSGTSADVRELLAREPHDPRAAEALELFCYQARKFIGALATTLGGLDALVFTGGIGEHAAPLRERICEGLRFMGVRLDTARNASHSAVISADDSPVTVRVVPTDEDLVIARHTRRIVEEEGA